MSAYFNYFDEILFQIYLTYFGSLSQLSSARKKMKRDIRKMLAKSSLLTDDMIVYLEIQVDKKILIKVQ